MILWKQYISEQHSSRYNRMWQSRKVLAVWFLKFGGVYIHILVLQPTDGWENESVGNCKEFVEGGEFHQHGCSLERAVEHLEHRRMDMAGQFWTSSTYISRTEVLSGEDRITGKGTWELIKLVDEQFRYVIWSESECKVNRKHWL